MSTGCETMLENLIGYVHGELDAPGVAAVETHLRECTGCHVEVGRLRKLEDLLRVHLPSIAPSPTFASTFANRLAAEVAAEDARRERPGLLGWLMRPWVIPAAALAVLVLTVTYSFGPQSGSAPVVALSKPALVAPDHGPRPQPEKQLAQKQSNQTGAPKSEAEVVKVPTELMHEADAFVDFAIIRDLRELESPGEAPGHTG